MADVEATQPPVTSIGDAIIDDGEEAESKVVFTSSLGLGIYTFAGNYAHEAESGRNGEGS